MLGVAFHKHLARLSQNPCSFFLTELVELVQVCTPLCSDMLFPAQSTNFAWDSGQGFVMALSANFGGMLRIIFLLEGPVVMSRGIASVFLDIHLLMMAGM